MRNLYLQVFLYVNSKSQSESQHVFPYEYRFIWTYVLPSWWRKSLSSFEEIFNETRSQLSHKDIFLRRVGVIGPLSVILISILSNSWSRVFNKIWRILVVSSTNCIKSDGPPLSVSTKYKRKRFIPMFSNHVTSWKRDQGCSCFHVSIKVQLSRKLNTIFN